jgi:hypothetical protein
MNNLELETYSQSLTQSSQDDSSILARILSQTPGRIRIQIGLYPDQRERINLVVIRLKHRADIDRVRANFHSGTITIFHNPKSINSVQILDLLTNLGLSFAKITPQYSSLTPEYSMAAIGVTQVTQDLNQKVRQTSNGKVDLGFLIPLSFALLACRQLIIKGWQLELIPWYVLAWYAFDSFLKLQGIDRGFPEIRQQGLLQSSFIN